MDMKPQMLKGTPAMPNHKGQAIIHFLNDSRMRATYGAVGEVLGILPRGVGQALGERRIEASWIVNKESGLPTDYSPDLLHPELDSNAEIINTGEELANRMAEWVREKLK